LAIELSSVFFEIIQKLILIQIANYTYENEDEGIKLSSDCLLVSLLDIISSNEDDTALTL